MTLVVAREVKGIIAIAADTLVSEHDVALPMKDWVLKSLCLPGGVCVSFSGSPELATRDIQTFVLQHSQGANYAATIGYFEKSSAATNNDYILAFSKSGKLVTIKDGARTSGLGRTHWIGDKEAYERFREHESRARSGYQDGRAINVAFFSDEMDGSPASDLYSTMRNVVLDTDVPSVGGFVTVLSSRPDGFRFSCYSDVLMDWPSELSPHEKLAYTDKIDLVASGENDRFSISQVSPGYLNMNLVAFYVLSGSLLVVFYQAQDGRTVCAALPGVAPDAIAQTLDQALSFPTFALYQIMSSREGIHIPVPRDNPEHGIGLSLFCEASSFPNVQSPANRS